MGKKKEIFWEVVSYFILALLVIGQVTIGKYYLFAQAIYFIANICGVIRDCAIKLPKSNIIRDICFASISLGLIIIRIF